MKDDMTALPNFPRLRQDVNIAFVANGSVLVRGQRGSVSLSGPFVQEALPGFLPMLDGQNSVDALIDGLDPEYRPEGTEILRVMQARGFLADGPAANGSDAGRDSFWAQEALDARKRLAAAHVVVAGHGVIGTALVQALDTGGVGRCTHLPRKGLDMAGAADAAFTDANLLILAADGMSLAGVDTVNETAHRLKKPWLLLRVDRSTALIGPHIVPGDTACFTCYELRARANAERPDEHQALFGSWRATPETASDFPTPPEYGQIVGNWVALDVMRALAKGRPPATLGRIIALNLATLGSTTRDILRLPRCPDCSRQVTWPLTRIWDIPKVAASAPAKQTA